MGFLLLFLLFHPGGARRRIRLEGSRHNAKKQSNTLVNDLEVFGKAWEALVPGDFGTGAFRRASPQQVRIRSILALGNKGEATRRLALKHAAAGVIPFLVSPARTSAVDQIGSAKSVADGNQLAQGFSGAIRSDIGPSVLGDGVEVIVTDLSYEELSACPPGFFIPPKGGPWTCIEITATALNQGRRKKPAAVDIFGLLFDAEGFACLSTALDPTTKGSPVATLVQEFPQGVKTPVKFVAAVQSRSPRPFKFAAFKGAYRSAATSKTFQSFDPCEIDSSKCEEDEDQPDNAKFGGAALYNSRK